MQKFLLFTSLAALSTTAGAVSLNVDDFPRIFGIGINDSSDDLQSPHKASKGGFDPFSSANRGKRVASNLAPILEAGKQTLRIDTPKISFPMAEENSERSFPFVSKKLTNKDPFEDLFLKALVANAGNIASQKRIATDNQTLDGENSVSSSALVSDKEDDSLPKAENRVVLNVGDEEIVDVFAEALGRTQARPDQDIMDAVLEVLSEIPAISDPKSDAEEAVVTSGSATSSHVPKAPPAPIFSQGTAKKITSLADLIREISSNPVTLRSSASSTSKTSDLEETEFNLGAMGTIKGLEVARLIDRMAKLKEAADKNSTPGSYGRNTEDSSTKTTVPLTWKKMGPSKIVLKKTSVQGNSMSLAEMLGGVKLKSSTQQDSSPKDSKEALQDDLKNALNGGLKLRPVTQNRDSREETSESVNFGVTLRAVKSGETQRKIGEEVQQKAKNKSSKTNVSVTTPPVTSLVTQTLVEPQEVTNTKNVMTSVVSQSEKGVDILSSLQNMMIKFNFGDVSSSSDNDDAWGDDEDDKELALSANTSSHQTEPKKDSEVEKKPVGTLKLKAGPKGGSFLDQIKAQRQEYEDFDPDAQDRINQALEAGRLRKEAQEKAEKEREEIKRQEEIAKMKALRAGAVDKGDDGAQDALLRGLKKIRASVDNDDGDDW